MHNSIRSQSRTRQRVYNIAVYHFIRQRVHTNTRTHPERIHLHTLAAIHIIWQGIVRARTVATFHNVGSLFYFIIITLCVIRVHFVIYVIGFIWVLLLFVVVSSQTYLSLTLLARMLPRLVHPPAVIWLKSTVREPRCQISFISCVRVFLLLLYITLCLYTYQLPVRRQRQEAIHSFYLRCLCLFPFFGSTINTVQMWTNENWRVKRIYVVYLRIRTF